MSQAGDLLYQNIGSLNDAKLGIVNLFPFTVESNETNELKRAVCEAIVNVFRNAGYQMEPYVASSAEPPHQVTISCRSCSAMLLVVGVSGGVANVPAASTISALSRLSHECPHKPITPDDQRRKIQEAVAASQGES